MRTSTLVLISCQFAALFGAVEAFSTPASLASPKSCLYSTATADDDTIPTNLPSDCGMDYIPLATMLATEQFEEADQVREIYRKNEENRNAIGRIPTNRFGLRENSFFIRLYPFPFFLFTSLIIQNF